MNRGRGKRKWQEKRRKRQQGRQTLHDDSSEVDERTDVQKKEQARREKQCGLLYSMSIGTSSKGHWSVGLMRTLNCIMGRLHTRWRTRSICSQPSPLEAPAEAPLVAALHLAIKFVPEFR